MCGSRHESAQPRPSLSDGPWVAEFAASLVGDRLRKYYDAIRAQRFATVLYLRLIYFPFTPLKFRKWD